MRVKTLRLKHCDILIIDKTLSEWVFWCLPEDAQVYVVETSNRGVITLPLDIKVIKYLLSGIIKYGFKSKTLLRSIIEVLNPGVVVTFIDNNPVMGDLQEMFPEKLIISIQNGMRSDHESSIGVWNSDYKIPVYYGFGGYDYDLMTENRVEVKEYNSVGSLKMGIYLSNQGKKLPSQNHICFISQFRNGNTPFIVNHDKVCRMVYILLLRWCKESGRKLLVAMVNEENDPNFNNEKNYYNHISTDGAVDLIPNIRRELKSYDVAFLCDLIVSVDSTLIFELFGCGKKTLFCGSSDIELMQKWGEEKMFSNMPKEVLLDHLDKERMDKKIEGLIKMDHGKYLSLTHKARSYLMKNKKPYPHEVIKKRINSYLASQTER